MPYKQFNVYSS